jgi:hypothetical protein
VADAAALREITRETPPLDDYHPLRLSPRMPAADAAAHDFFFALSEPVVTRPRFAASALIRRLWPEAMRAGTLARFEDQEIVNRFYWRGAGPGGVGLGDVERLLRHSEVRTPVLWLLGSDDEQERAARRALGGGVDEPLLHETLGASSFADRDYAKAESWYARAQPGSADPERAAILRTFARVMSGDEAGARTLLREAVGSGPLQHRAPWQWLAQRLGEPDPF